MSFFKDTWLSDAIFKEFLHNFNFVWPFEIYYYWRRGWYRWYQTNKFLKQKLWENFSIYFTELLMKKNQSSFLWSDKLNDFLISETRSQIMIFCSSQFTEMILLVSHLVSCDQFTSVIGNNKVQKILYYILST